MNPEERDRLVRLETEYLNIKEMITGIAVDVADIRKAAHMGRGAWLSMLRMGAVLAALLGAAAWLWDHFGHK